MDSLGVAPRLTARWAGLMWPTPSETLCWQPKAKETVHWTAKASLGRCEWRALTLLMKCVNVDRAQCCGWYTDSGPDCGFLTRLCRFSGDDNNKALVSETTNRDTQRHFWEIRSFAFLAGKWKRRLTPFLCLHTALHKDRTGYLFMFIGYNRSGYSLCAVLR